MEGGPWQFRRDLVVLVEYDGFTNVANMSLRCTLSGPGSRVHWMD